MFSKSGGTHKVCFGKWTSFNRFINILINRNCFLVLSGILQCLRFHDHSTNSWRIWFCEKSKFGWSWACMPVWRVQNNRENTFVCIIWRDAVWNHTLKAQMTINKNLKVENWRKKTSETSALIGFLLHLLNSWHTKNRQMK